MISFIEMEHPVSVVIVWMVGHDSSLVGSKPAKHTSCMVQRQARQHEERCDPTVHRRLLERKQAPYLVVVEPASSMLESKWPRLEGHHSSIRELSPLFGLHWRRNADHPRYSNRKHQNATKKKRRVWLVRVSDETNRWVF